MIFILLPLFLLTLGYELIRLWDQGFSPSRLPIYLIVLPFMLVAWCLRPIMNFIKSLKILRSYYFDKVESRWQFVTLANKSFQTDGLVNESIGELTYFGDLFKAKIFEVDRRKYYFLEDKKKR